ncbi:apolipoprotein N-acyltransferase [Shimia sediminis]|uniref:apolipoprotein N-acyltransferase n=1 Tax=Shimia sediminis TaxID=2497945 RepID=UPI000F8CC119|nr:apolipoprotein N-acyltransferase [Shimia sediminis]
MADQLTRWFATLSRRWRLLLLFAFGAVAALGQAPFSLVIPSFLGFVAVFAMYPALSSSRQAFGAGFVFGTGYFAASLHWIVEPFLVDLARHGWMAPFALVFLSCGLALLWATAFALSRRISVQRWALVPMLAGAELVRAYLFTGFPWAMPSYALVNGIAGQGASWIGPHGMNLVLLATACALADWRVRKPIALIGVVLVVLSAWPLSQPHPSDGQGRIVRLVQPNAPQHQKWDPDYMRIFFDRALRSTRSGLALPDLIVWPETSVPTSLDRSTNTRAAIAEAARGVPVVIGINRYDGLRAYNSAVVLDGEGAIGDVYDKHHLVPFGEYVPFGNLLSRFGIHGLAAREGGGYSAGPGPRLIDVGVLGHVLPLICYEAVFPQDMRVDGARPDVLMQITNDAWFGRFSGPYQHLVQARMRAIEQGLPMVRAANTGVSAVIDPRGRVVASLDLNTEGFLDAALPEPMAITVYGQTGDWPIIAIVLATLGLLFRVRRSESN